MITRHPDLALGVMFDRWLNAVTPATVCQCKTCGRPLSRGQMMVDHVTGGTLLCNRKPCECVGTVVRKSSVANLGNRHRVVGRFGGVPYCSNIFLLCS